MLKTYFKPLSIAILILLAALALGVYTRTHHQSKPVASVRVVSTEHPSESSVSTPGVLPATVSTTPIVRPIEAQYPAGLEDDRILSGGSHNMFVGKVLRQVGNQELVGWRFPATQFAVEVILNIKGNLRGVVTVNQVGGYKNGILYLMDGKYALLELGATYLLSTRYSQDNNWYGVSVPPFDTILLTNNSALSTVQLMTLSQDNERVKALRAAYPREILAGVDTGAKSTWNSYTSRHYDTKSELIDDTVVLHEQYMAAHPSISSEPPSSTVPAANTPASEPAEPSVAPTPTAEPSVEPSLTPEPTATPAPEITPTPAPSPELTPTSEPSATPTPTTESTPEPTAS
jgi:hypothetical protein